MSIAQYLRIIWARKWLVLALLLLTTLAGTLITVFPTVAAVPSRV